MLQVTCAPGFSGILVGILILAVIWLIGFFRTRPGSFDFDPLGERGKFEPLLTTYLHLAEVLIGLSAGSIVLLIGSSAFHSAGRLPRVFGSPLFLLVLSIMYGILFMVFLTHDYESYRHHPTSGTYTRFRYTRNQALGFGGLTCFCIGYVWLIVAAIT